MPVCVTPKFKRNRLIFAHSLGLGHSKLDEFLLDEELVAYKRERAMRKQK